MRSGRRASAHPRAGVLVWGALTGLVALLLVRPYPPGMGITRALEACIYLVLATYLFTRPTVRALVADVAPRYVILVAVLVLSATVIQLLKLGGRQVFPMVSWYMYAEPRPALTFLRQEVVHGSGIVRPFPYRALAPGRGGPFRNALNEWARAAVAGDAPGQSARAARRGQQWPRLARELTAIHNMRHPRDPIVTVRTITCVIDLRARTRQAAVRCAAAHSVDVSPEQR